MSSDYSGNGKLNIQNIIPNEKQGNFVLSYLNILNNMSNCGCAETESLTTKNPLENLPPEECVEEYAECLDIIADQNFMFPGAQS